MAVWIKWTEKQEKLWAEWMAGRPASVREMVEKYNLRADKLYELTTTGQRVTLHSFSENGTVTVNVLDKYNQHKINGIIPLINEVRVFGIDPAELVECEWSGEVEDGALCEND